MRTDEHSAQTAGADRVKIIVGVSDAAISDRPEDVLVTYALGSCIGVALHDAKAGVGGLLHFQLPCSSLDANRPDKRPLMFADTGIESVLRQMARFGGEKRRMRVRICGGANMLNDNGLFDIGRRNNTAIRKALWVHGVLVDKAVVGGTSPMNMQLSIETGELLVKRDGMTSIL